MFMNQGKAHRKKPLESHRMILKKMSENVGNKRGGKRLSKAMKEAGYSESYIRSGHIKGTKSWHSLVDTELSDEVLLKVHKGLLQNKEWRARDAGLEKAYKLKKRYKEEITLKHEFEDLSDEELEKEMAKILAEAIDLVV